ncbi:hypothetical protein [Corallococcus sp. AB030]|uniref:hypothetical protein n=1 Tax=Corallococcus sp. AB030 TaxID=2316716 RepID=UPI0011E5F31B|nr:hypothetical protein [Corallococcus sp. AB030]
MLCRECEERIGKAEDYVSSVSLQSDGSFPAYGDTVLIPMGLDPDWELGNASALDCEAIAYFAASIVWRASVSTLYSKISLGSKYESKFRDYLLGKAPFPKEARLLVEFIRPANLPRIDRVVVMPEVQREDTSHLYQFCIFGMRFRLLVGRLVPSVFNHASFVETRYVILSDGRDLLSVVADKAKRATRKGRLARPK